MAIIIKTLILILAILASQSYITGSIKRNVTKLQAYIVILIWVIFYLLEKLWI